MAKTCKNKKLKKAFGGLIKNDPLTEYLALANERSFSPGTIPHPNQAIANNQIAKSRAQVESSTNLTKGLDITAGLLSMLGSAAKSMNFEGMGGGTGKADYSASFAYGGEIPKRKVEVEGEEIVETPQGNIMEILGAKHEQGGVDMNLPVGSEVFSDRIKVDDKTLADRKKRRTKKEKTLTQLLKDFEHDYLIENSNDRTKQVHDKQNNQDKQIQEVVNILKEAKGKNFAFGTSFGGVPGNPLNLLEEDINSMGALGKVNNVNSNNFWLEALESLSKTQNQNNLPIKSLKDLDSIVPNGNNVIPLNKKSFDFTKLISEFKKNAPVLGDAVGVGGNLFQAFAPYMNTRRNRATDTPNINAFTEYGKTGLSTLDNSKSYIDQVKNTKKNELNLARNTSSTRNRNSARSVNTMRALDLATEASMNTASNQIDDSFANAMLNILSQQSQMENMRDQVVMSGEQARDLADRQDKGAFATNISKDLAEIGEGVSKTGKHTNQVKTREVSMAAINQISEYFGIDPKTAKLIQKGNINLTPGLEYRKIVNPNTKKVFTKPEWEALSSDEKIKYLDDFEKGVEIIQLQGK